MDTPNVTTTTPTVGATAPNNTQRVDQIASEFATLATEAQQYAWNQRAEMASVIKAEMTKTPNRSDG